MARRQHSTGRLRSVRASLALGLVGGLAGLLFATNAGLFAESSERRPQDLRDLVRDESDRMQVAAQEVAELRSEVDDLIGELESTDPGSGVGTDVEIAAGRLGVTGPGLRVEMWDSPYTEPPSGYVVSDLVVHQQDLQAVINGLRAGGAEAVAVQGHRVTATTSIRCVGNVLLVDGQTYSPPYVIEAIGDPIAMMDAVNDSHAVRGYLQFVNLLRLGWSMQPETEIEIRGFEGNITMSHAQVPGHEPFTPADESPWIPRDDEGLE